MKRFNFLDWLTGVTNATVLVFAAVVGGAFVFLSISVSCWGDAVFSPDTRELYVPALQVEKNGVFEATFLLDDQNPFDFFLISIDPATNDSSISGTLDRFSGDVELPVIAVELAEARKQSYRAEMMLITTAPPCFRLTKLEQFGDVIGVPHDTVPVLPGSVTIDGVGTFSFDPGDVKTVRPDLFNPGYFSLFDLLVHLSDVGHIRLHYHFDKTMDTHVIDSLNGSSDWWYEVWYDGGWPERSVHRMDYYPVKDKMHIRFLPAVSEDMKFRYETWKTEVFRKSGNRGEIIIPSVQVERYGTFSMEFSNVAVTLHNLRGDALAEGTITALDIILSLADRGDLSYQAMWTEHIGSAEIKNYYLECVNTYCHSGMCGFVYEVGESAGSGARGNHIHLQTDLRILQSPEYAHFFWIQLGPCN